MINDLHRNSDGSPVFLPKPKSKIDDAVNDDEPPPKGPNKWPGTVGDDEPPPRGHRHKPKKYANSTGTSAAELIATADENELCLAAMLAQELSPEELKTAGQVLEEYARLDTDEQAAERFSGVLRRSLHGIGSQLSAQFASQLDAAQQRLGRVTLSAALDGAY